MLGIGFILASIFVVAFAFSILSEKLMLIDDATENLGIYSRRISSNRDSIRNLEQILYKQQRANNYHGYRIRKILKS